MEPLIQNQNVNTQLPLPPPSPKKTWVGVGIGILLITAIGGGGFFLWKKGFVGTLTTGKQADTAPRVERFPDDLDRDGIPNAEEETLGLNARELDTDGDALSDYDEVRVWKTDPKKVDTDGDGFRDAVEIVSGNNPLGAGKLTQ